MKIIFLDLDGVMCTSNDYGTSMDNKWGSYRFDRKCVGVLNFILQGTGAEIILSSDWRNHYTLQEMREIFVHNGVIRGPIGFTSNSKSYKGDNLEGGRAEEIHDWLQHHCWKGDVKWVAVDDLDLSMDFVYNGVKIEGLGNFVRCPRHREGIKQSGIKEKILKFLE